LFRPARGLLPLVKVAKVLLQKPRLIEAEQAEFAQEKRDEFFVGKQID